MNPTTEWEERFDEMYYAENPAFDFLTREGIRRNREIIKSFISSLLAEQKKKAIEAVNNSRTVEEHLGIGIREATARAEALKRLEEML